MLTELWGSAAKNLWERLAASAPGATTFWLGGLLAWSLGRGGPGHLRSVISWLGRQSGPAQVGLLIVALMTVVVSGLVMQRLTLPALRLLEGYWPHFLDRCRSALIKKIDTRDDADGTRERALIALTAEGKGTDEERRELARLTWSRRRLPGKRHGRQPTRLGNLLRAAETRPKDKYGLDVVATWPHLWLVFPQDVRKQLDQARNQLDAAVAGCLWGLAFLAFTPWTLWALPVGLVVAAAVYQLWLPVRAEAFADLLEASVDLYRDLLYRQLRWPLPESPETEPASGEAVTTYLIRGLSPAGLEFTENPTGEPAGGTPRRRSWHGRWRGSWPSWSRNRTGGPPASS